MKMGERVGEGKRGEERRREGNGLITRIRDVRTW